MKTTIHIAKHLREVFLGGNWTASNLKDALKDVSWQEATTAVYDLNTIATLVYHMRYYISAVLKVLEGDPLDAKDKYSFNHPPIQSQEDWDNMIADIWTDVESFAVLIEALPDPQLWDDFSEKKYGTYYRNLQGIIEHTHYHLGQVVLVKKILKSQMQQ